ncbi:DGQHR domain-containing protein [Dyadobacter endophyticus]|uniref:DGQHR domain-containing protein n=1 Tax=Dyadobacter endophyticus TaxID=1749036 RepID=UPI003CE803F3
MEYLIDRPDIVFNCLEARQPIGNMYVGIINYDDLEYISYADVRRLELGNDNREVEEYIGIQRNLDPKREKDIGKYVNLVDATFPNSIILAMSSEHAKFDPKTSTMKVPYKDDIAKVLDGQHRIAGLRGFNNRDGSAFQCIVTIYVDMELEDQAIVFATINKEQKNVSNSLVADLFAFAKSRSPQKTGHNIARALNEKSGSPFYQKIKILGVARDNSRETITQDTFVKSLIAYISKEPQKDRDFYKRNAGSSKKLPLVSGTEAENLFLRNLFIEDESDVKIAQIIFNYFYAVSHKWPSAWNFVSNNQILNKSTGFIALMRFFKHAYLHLANGNLSAIPSKEQFLSVFTQITLTDSDFNRERYIPGSSGQGQLYRDLRDQSGL